MNLIKFNRPDLWNWSPANRWGTLRDEFDRLFDEAWGSLARGSEFFTGWAPALDLYEDKDSLTATIELPGMKKEDISVSFENGMLTITGERKREHQQDESGAYRSERFYGRFHRSLTLPKPVNVDKVKAAYKDGVLTITLPKVEEAKPKQIEVSVS